MFSLVGSLNLLLIIFNMCMYYTWNLPNIYIMGLDEKCTCTEERKELEEEIR